MEVLDIVKKLNEKSRELERAEQSLEQFKLTKEFCTIEITGEDGNERGYTYFMKEDYVEIEQVRKLIEQLLINNIRDLEQSILLMVKLIRNGKE